MKTYFIRFLDSREETVKASSVRVTAKMVSFYRGKSLVLAAPVSEIMRIADTRFKSYAELEQEENHVEAAAKIRRMMEETSEETNLTIKAA